MQEIDLGGGRTARRAYDLDDITFVPTKRTRDRRLVDLSWELDAYALDLPLLSAPLDAVTSPQTAAGRRGPRGLGVLNLEGLWTRYDDPAEVFAEIAGLQPGPAATQRLQELYDEPVKEELIGRRVEELKAAGYAAGSLTPQKVERYHHAALEAGLDLLVVQGVVVTAQQVGRADEEPLDLRAFTARYDIPVVVGGVASEKSALHLMRTGAVGVIVGVGVSTVSTTDRGARHRRATRHGDRERRCRPQPLPRRVRPLRPGDRDRAACGPVATSPRPSRSAPTRSCSVARWPPPRKHPAHGAYWGLAAAHHELPRGRFERVETLGTLEQLLTGPAHRDDGTANLFGGLRTDDGGLRRRGPPGYAPAATGGAGMTMPPRRRPTRQHGNVAPARGAFRAWVIALLAATMLVAACGNGDSPGLIELPGGESSGASEPRPRHCLGDGGSETGSEPQAPAPEPGETGAEHVDGTAAATPVDDGGGVGANGRAMLRGDRAAAGPRDRCAGGRVRRPGSRRPSRRRVLQRARRQARGCRVRRRQHVRLGPHRVVGPATCAKPLRPTAPRHPTTDEVSVTSCTSGAASIRAAQETAPSAWPTPPARWRCSRSGGRALAACSGRTVPSSGRCSCTRLGHLLGAREPHLPVRHRPRGPGASQALEQPRLGDVPRDRVDADRPGVLGPAA